MSLSVKFTTSLEQRAKAASEAAAAAVFAELNRRFQDAIGAKAWNWPRATKRTGGVIPAGPRNIVDRSILKNSNPGPQINGLKVEYRWAEPYASFVHEGARIYPYGDKTRKRVLLPARPWTSAVLGTVKVSGIEVYPMADRFKKLWLQRFRRNA